MTGLDDDGGGDAHQVGEEGHENPLGDKDGLDDGGGHGAQGRKKATRRGREG